MTQTDEALADEGFAAPEAAPDEVPATVRGETVPDEGLSYDDIRYEHRMLTREFEDLSRTYGGFEHAPGPVQEQMGAMSARIRHLTEMQNRRARNAIRDEELFEGLTIDGKPTIVDWDRYQELDMQPPREIIYDWRNVLTNGTPSTQVARTMMKGNMATAVSLISGGRPGISGGRLLANSLPSQRAAIEARKGPMEALRSRLIAVSEEAASQSAADKAAMESLEASVTANEAMIDATRNRLTAEAAAPSPEYAAAEAGAQAARSEITAENTAAQRQIASLEMDRLRAEQQYSQKLSDLDMQLGDVREQIVLVRNEHAVMERLRDEFNRALDTVPNKDNMRDLVEDLRQLNEWRRGRPSAAAPADIPDATIDFVESLLQSAARAVTDKDFVALLNDTLIAHRLKEWESGARSVTPVVQRVITDAWKPMAKELLTGPDAVVMARDLASAIEHVIKASAQPQTWKLVDKYTAFFKTYATVAPGSTCATHLSAMFMNLVDGVRIRDMGAAPGLWRAFMADPREAGSGREPRCSTPAPGRRCVTHLTVVFGVGCRWTVGRGTASARRRRPRRGRTAALMNNKLTRWNHRTGSFVEGAARMGMAIDYSGTGDAHSKHRSSG